MIRAARTFSQSSCPATQFFIFFLMLYAALNCSRMRVFAAAKVAYLMGSAPTLQQSQRHLCILMIYSLGASVIIRLNNLHRDSENAKVSA